MLCYKLLITAKRILISAPGWRVKMGPLIGYLVGFPASFLFLYVIMMIVKFLHKVWWMPIRIQHAMRSQGIKGPSYMFFHGNTKEISNMRLISMGRPMDHLSHEIFPRILPHVHSWVNLYGNFISIHDSCIKLSSSCC